MAELITQYTDAKNITHIVQHLTVPHQDKSEKERVAEELYKALTKKREKNIPQ